MNQAEELARAFGYLSVDEVGALKSLVRMIKARPIVIVNVGAGAGTSSLAMAEACDEIGAQRILYSIDNSPGGPLGGLEGENNAFRNANMFPPHQILDDSRIAGRYWVGEQIDLLFIDDGHLEPEIQGDIDAWMPNLKDGGIVAFHDYGTAKWPDVEKVVNRNFTKGGLLRTKSIIAFKKQ